MFILIVQRVELMNCVCAGLLRNFSGRRPDTSQVWTFETTWREAGTTADQRARVRNFTDLPQWFKQNGWWTTNTGKTWHNSVGYNPADDWSDLNEFPSMFAWPGMHTPRNICEKISPKSLRNLPYTYTGI